MQPVVEVIREASSLTSMPARILLACSTRVVARPTWRSVLFGSVDPVGQSIRTVRLCTVDSANENRPYPPGRKHWSVPSQGAPGRITGNRNQNGTRTVKTDPTRPPPPRRGGSSNIRYNVLLYGENIYMILLYMIHVVYTQYIIYIYIYNI